MANHHGSLEAIVLHIDSVRYNMVLDSRAGNRLRCLIRHIRRCSDADTTNKCLSQAVDRHIGSVRYDMVLDSRAGGRLRCLIRSPTTLQRRRYDQQMLEP
eukprot:scaffold17441_cov204-Skeletonema_marinoi.AAC.1